MVDKEQWVTVDPSTKPTSMSKEYWDKLDRKARSVIILFLSDSMFFNVFWGHSIKNPWEKLRNLYHSKYLEKKCFL